METYSSCRRSASRCARSSAARKPLAEVLPAAAAHLGHSRQLGLELRSARRRVRRAELAEERADHALALLEQRQQQVLRARPPGGSWLVGQGLRGLHGFLRLDRELVQSHRSYPSARIRCEADFAAERLQLFVQVFLVGGEVGRHHDLRAHQLSRR